MAPQEHALRPEAEPRDLRILADRVAEAVDLAVPLLGRRHIVTELLVLAMARSADAAAEAGRERIATAAENYLAANGPT